MTATAPINDRLEDSKITSFAPLL